MGERIDVDIIDAVTEGVDVKVCSDKLLDTAVEVASGKRVAVEVLGHREFAIER